MCHVCLQTGDENPAGIQAPATQQAAVMAVLAGIGSIDTRPRLGGLVTHEEFDAGTVARIVANGKVTVHFHDLCATKVCRLTELSPVRATTFCVYVCIL